MQRVVLAVLVLLLVDCGGSLQIAIPDQRPPDGPLTDGPRDDDLAPGPADGGTAADRATGNADTAAPQPDASADTAPPDTGGPPPPGPLQATGPGPFVRDPATALDVTTLVTGGARPLVCSLYTGPGHGTVPTQVTLNGCTLSGGFAATDMKGTYGFLVVVSDQQGATLELPIAMRNGSCAAGNTGVTPAEWPARIIAPGSAATWTVRVADVDAPCTDGTCSLCRYCLSYDGGTTWPLLAALGLDCAGAGDVCIAVAGFSALTACPSPPVTWTAELRLRAHAVLRTDGKPGWASLGVIAQYSGTIVTGDCGPKLWGCHIEALER